MTDDRELDLLVAELDTENRMIRARNERLEKELRAATAERDRFKEAMERIIAVSSLAFWDGVPPRTEKVGAPKRVQEAND